MDEKELNKKEGLKTLYDYCKFQYNLIWSNIDDCKKYSTILAGPALIMLGICLNLFIPFNFDCGLNILISLGKILAFLLLILTILFSLIGSRPISYIFPSSSRAIFEVFKQTDYQATTPMFIKFIDTIGGSIDNKLSLVRIGWRRLRWAFGFLCSALLIFMFVEGAQIYLSHSKTKTSKEEEIIMDEDKEKKNDKKKEDEEVASPEDKMRAIPDEKITAAEEKGPKKEEPKPKDDDKFNDIPEEDITKGL